MRPKSSDNIQHQIRPQWLGSTISYIIYERLGTQKLYSVPASITIPAILETPGNISYYIVYEEGIGDMATISWDHAIIFRNYIIEQYIDGAWTRIDKIADNTVSIHVLPGEHQFRVYSHISGAFSEPGQITVEVP